MRCGAVPCSLLTTYCLLLTAYYLLHLARPVEAIRLRGSSDRLCSLVPPAEVSVRGQRAEACGMSEGQNGLAFGVISAGPWPRSKVQSSHPPLGMRRCAGATCSDVCRAVCAGVCAGVCVAVWNECAAALQPGTPFGACNRPVRARVGLGAGVFAPTTPKGG